MCSTGFPSPKITWRRKEGILLPTGKETHTATKLTITKARSEDRGVPDHESFHSVCYFIVLLVNRQQAKYTEKGIGT